MAKKTPEINATSTADIAFLLLVFFLATTSMNVDSGIFRRLPPYSDNQEAPNKINNRNIFKVMITRNNELGINDNPADISTLKERIIEFIRNDANSASLPQKEVKNIPLLGNVEVSKGIVSLLCDRGTSFEMYIAVQDKMTEAFIDVRNQRAQQYFNKKYNDLDKEKQDAIRSFVPMLISEAEPKNIGGKK